MSPRPSFLSCIFAVLWAASLSAPAEPTITGAWVLDAKMSADPEDAFKGKLRRDSYPVPHTATGGERNTPHDVTQSAYWDTIRAGKEAHSIKNLRRLGIAYPMVKAEKLELSAEDGGYELLYDGDLPRTVRPNPKGKVFSAKGDELVHDTFGYTLSYWDKDSLVLEADAPEGGRVVERLTLRENPHQLEYVVRVQMPLLTETVEVKRLFNPAGAAR